MHAQQLALDVIAGNLANANSTAFKSDRLSFREALDREVHAPGEAATRTVGRLGGGAVVEGRTMLGTQGALIPTGNALDVAIEGEGYFSVRTPAGVRYTRAGSFQVDATGMLTTRDGHPVLGSNGPIQVPRGATPTIDPTGLVQAGGATLDRLAVVTGDLTKAGNGLYVGAAKPLANPRLEPGYLEASNVNAVTEMVHMIATLRVFEANQRVVQAQDETLQKAVNDLARLG